MLLKKCGDFLRTIYKYYEIPEEAIEIILRG